MFNSHVLSLIHAGAFVFLGASIIAMFMAAIAVGRGGEIYAYSNASTAAALTAHSTESPAQ